MILALILSIFSATFTLTSTTEVMPSGVLPDSSTYEYKRSATTGQKGQMTAGNTTCLELNGWDGCIIRKVELQMHSNTKSGRGSLDMTVDNNVVWAIEDQDFCEEAWAGMYTPNWVPITHNMNVLVNNDPIEILISATENSLYIHSYTIYYEKAYHTVMPDMPSIPSVSLEARSYTVYFNTGCDTTPLPITQESPGTPIILPAWQDTLSWYFMGWTEAEVVDNKLHTPVLQPGQKYIPTRNTKLWAVYSDINEHIAIDTYSTGKYVISCDNQLTQELLNAGFALTGKIQSNILEGCGVSMYKNADGVYCLGTSITNEMQYIVDFKEDSTALITHSASREPIGYKEKNLEPVSALWKYRVLEDKSVIFYYLFENKEYCLYVKNKDNEETPCALTYKMSISLQKNNGFWLFPIAEHLTSWPLGIHNAVDDINRPIESFDAIYHFGIYELHIRNGKKSLIIR